MDTLQLLQELVSVPGPPGQEAEVRAVLEKHLRALKYESTVDAKGNLLVDLGGGEPPRIVVTAHMDEVAMIVRGVHADGSLAVGPMGGLYAWKLGEGPASILAPGGALNGVLSLGSIHTDDPSSTVESASSEAVTWDMATVLTGLPEEELVAQGVRLGTRVVVHPSRRTLTPMGDLVSGYFFDDRADLVSWLLALEQLKGKTLPVVFAATTSEEVGGEGAQYLLHRLQPDVCIALELGPNVPDAPVDISDQPTVWATDSYSSMTQDDGETVARTGERLGMDLQFQALSRGGSDASCSAGRGLCARPVTLGLPMENSHGYEVMHPGAMANLAALTAALVQEL